MRDATSNIVESSELEDMSEGKFLLEDDVGERS